MCEAGDPFLVVPAAAQKRCGNLLQLQLNCE